MVKKKKVKKGKSSKGDFFNLAVNPSSRKTNFFLGYDAPKTKLKKNSKPKRGDFSLGLKNQPLSLAGSKKMHNMGWKQAKKAYPSLNPLGDSDSDGVLNNRDCKPFDPTRHGVLSRALGKITGDRFGQSKADFRRERELKREGRQTKVRQAVTRKVKERIASRETGISQREAKQIVRQQRREQKLETPKKVVGALVQASKKFKAPGAFKRTSKGVSIAGVTLKKGGTGGTGKRGRPKGSFKYTDPITGKPVPYTTYRSRTRQLKSRRRNIAELRQAEQRTRLARKGIPPGVTQQLQDARNAQLRQAAQRVLTPQEELVTAQGMLEQGASVATPEQLQRQAITQQQLAQLQVQQAPTTPQGMTLTVERLRKIAELKRRGYQVLPDGTVIRPKQQGTMEGAGQAIQKVTKFFNGLKGSAPEEAQQEERTL